MIREDIRQKFPDLFGTKYINGREVDVEHTIDTVTRELGPEIAAALEARRALLQSPAPVSSKYAWPKWSDTFEDPVSGRFWTFRQIVQGLIDNVLDFARGRLGGGISLSRDANRPLGPLQSFSFGENRIFGTQVAVSVSSSSPSK